jgi:hypothetical protein
MYRRRCFDWYNLKSSKRPSGGWSYPIKLTVPYSGITPPTQSVHISSESVIHIPIGPCRSKRTQRANLFKTSTLKGVNQHCSSCLPEASSHSPNVQLWLPKAIPIATWEREINFVIILRIAKTILPQ